jgi:putative phosphoribosyl transferase
MLDVTPMQFDNRTSAALLLADALGEWRSAHPLILAIPRGAVPMGRVIADALAGELDVVLTRKISAPGQPEFAIGAVGESGWSIIDPSALKVGANRHYIDREIAAQLALMAKRRTRYTPHRAPIEVAGRVVIIVDDGLATGATMVAALHDTRERHPALLVCATPVASTTAHERVSGYADRVICLEVSDDFYGVGEFYRDFAQVSDDEVIATLHFSTNRRFAASKASRNAT